MCAAFISFRDFRVRDVERRPRKTFRQEDADNEIIEGAKTTC
jgi:hypothetical protein